MHVECANPLWAFDVDYGLIDSRGQCPAMAYCQWDVQKARIRVQIMFFIILFVE